MTKTLPPGEPETGCRGMPMPGYSGGSHNWERVGRFARCRRCGDIVDPKKIPLGRPKLQKALR